MPARPLDARVVALLAGVATQGSLAAAALGLGLPYRTAWALLRDAETDLGRPLLARARGRGAKPTALGERLLAADRAARDFLATRQAALAVPLRATPGPRPGRVLRIAASHDLALAELRDLWRTRHRVDVEFHGSAEAIALYAQERVAVAGFHVLAGPRGAHDPLLAALDPARDAILRFVVREQGLILPRGNPRGVRGFADVAAQRLAFVNRQPGSGTRLIVERLLHQARIAPVGHPRLHPRGVHPRGGGGDRRRRQRRLRLRPARRRGAAVAGVRPAGRGALRLRLPPARRRRRGAARVPGADRRRVDAQGGLAAARLPARRPRHGDVGRGVRDGRGRRCRRRPAVPPAVSR